jgi:hypothetical protein
VTLLTWTCSSVDSRRLDIASRTKAKAAATSSARTPIALRTRIAIGAESMISISRS